MPIRALTALLIFVKLGTIFAGAEIVSRFSTNLDWPVDSIMGQVSFGPGFLLGVAIMLMMFSVGTAIYCIPVVLHALFRKVDLNKKSDDIFGLISVYVELWLALLLFDLTLFGVLSSDSLWNSWLGTV